MSGDYIFRSAFTPEGWVEPLHDSAESRVLVTAPPCNTPHEFWQNLTPEYAQATELYPDPLVPNRLEGFGTARRSWLLCDSLHPRHTQNAPFADDIFDLYSCVAPLSCNARKDGLLLLQRRQEALHDAKSALAGTLAFLGENLRIAANALDIHSVQELADELAEKYFAGNAASPGKASQATTRFFTAFTANGPFFCSAALFNRSDIRISLKDENGAAARMLMYLLHRKATQQGETLCIGRCPLFWPDKIDHLIFEERRLLFTTSNRFHSLSAATQQIDCSFLYRSLSSSETERIRENHRHGKQLLVQARFALRECWRIQAALAVLCPLSCTSLRLFSSARSTITTKNAADT